MLGVYLVLLTPCIDYVIVFTKMGKGNESILLKVTPILLILQTILLPIYLFVLLGEKAISIVRMGPFLDAFLFLIFIPLLLAIMTQLCSKKSSLGNRIMKMPPWIPVPFMSFVLFVVVASQIREVYSDLGTLIDVIPIYILFLLIIPWVSKSLGKLFKLDIASRRAITFSMGTRNSLVVLPLASILPEPLSTQVAVVIILQTVTELFGEVLYIKLVPKWF